MQGKLVIVVVLLAALFAAAPARAQLSADHGNGIRLAASDTNVLVTWSDGTNQLSTTMDKRGRVLTRTAAYTLGVPGGPAVGGPHTAWSPRTKRFVIAWTAPDGIRVRFLAKNGNPVGAPKLVLPTQPGAFPGVWDLATDPREGTTVVSVLESFMGTSGALRLTQIQLDRRGKPGKRWPITAMATAGRPEGGWLSLIGEAGHVFLQRLTPAGKRSGPRRRLTDMAIVYSGALLKVHPRSGQAMGFWTGYKGVITQPLTADGKPLARYNTIKGTGTHGAFTSLAPYGRDGWLLAYRAELMGLNEIVVRRLDRLGRPAAEPVIVNQGNADPWAHSPSLGSIGTSVLVGYGHQRDAYSDKVVVVPVRP